MAQASRKTCEGITKWVADNEPPGTNPRNPRTKRCKLPRKSGFATNPYTKRYVRKAYLVAHGIEIQSDEESNDDPVPGAGPVPGGPLPGPLPQGPGPGPNEGDDDNEDQGADPNLDPNEDQGGDGNPAPANNPTPDDDEMAGAGRIAGGLTGGKRRPTTNPDGARDDRPGPNPGNAARYNPVTNPHGAGGAGPAPANNPAPDDDEMAGAGRIAGGLTGGKRGATENAEEEEEDPPVYPGDDSRLNDSLLNWMETGLGEGLERFDGVGEEKGEDEHSLREEKDDGGPRRPGGGPGGGGPGGPGGPGGLDYPKLSQEVVKVFQGISAAVTADGNTRQICGILEIQQDGFPGCSGEVVEDIHMEYGQNSECGLTTIRKSRGNAFYETDVTFVDDPSRVLKNKAILWEVCCSEKISGWHILRVLHQLPKHNVDVVFLCENTYWRISGHRVYPGFSMEVIIAAVNNLSELSEQTLNEFFGQWIHFEVNRYDTPSKAFHSNGIEHNRFRRLGTQIATGTMIAAKKAASNLLHDAKTNLRYTKDIMTGVAIVTAKTSIRAHQFDVSNVEKQILDLTYKLGVAMNDVDVVLVGNYLNYMAFIEEPGEQINAYRDNEFENLVKDYKNSSGVPHSLALYLNSRRSTSIYVNPADQGAIDASLKVKLKSIFTIEVAPLASDVRKVLAPSDDIYTDLLKWAKIVAFAAYYHTIPAVNSVSIGDRCVENPPVMLNAVPLATNENGTAKTTSFLDDIVVSILDQILNLKYNYMLDGEWEEVFNGISSTSRHSFPQGLWGSESSGNGGGNGGGGNGGGGGSGGGGNGGGGGDDADDDGMGDADDEFSDAGDGGGDNADDEMADANGAAAGAGAGGGGDADDEMAGADRGGKRKAKTRIRIKRYPSARQGGPEEPAATRSARPSAISPSSSPVGSRTRSRRRTIRPVSSRTRSKGETEGLVLGEEPRKRGRKLERVIEGEQRRIARKPSEFQPVREEEEEEEEEEEKEKTRQQRWRHLKSSKAAIAPLSTIAGSTWTGHAPSCGVVPDLAANFYHACSLGEGVTAYP